MHTPAIVSPSITLWDFPAEDLKLAADEVHVWRIDLDGHGAGVSDLRSLLSAEEQERADRFYFRRDHDRFVITRGTLRTLLGRYLEISPTEVQIGYNAHGKPALALPERLPDLRFNVSHSSGLAVLAVTEGRELGVDVEQVRRGLARQQLAEQYFAPREVTVLRSLPAVQQDEAFFRCWTRKEAYVKARGAGLSTNLDSFEVSMLPGEVAALLSHRDEPQEILRWTFESLEPAPNYLAALAVEGDDWRLECGTWH